MTNRNFGKLNGNILEYAPNSFKTEIGIIINPPKSMYISKGYYEIIDIKPEPESGCFVKFNGYEKNDDEKTIRFSYVQQMIPIIRESYTYSKLRLEESMFKMGKSQLLDDFIDQTMLSNSFGDEVSLRKFYDQAQELKSDNDLFKAYLSAGQQALGIDDSQMNEILEYCKIS